MKKFLIIIVAIVIVWDIVKPPINVENANTLIIDEQDKLTYNLPINPPEEFDFLTKRNIINKRKQYAASSMNFVSKKYSPSEYVFSNIRDNKHWWGLNGSMYKGPGKGSIEGLSEESRFINNPLLLLGVDSFFRFKDIKISGPEIYPKPTSIKIQPSKKTITVVYNYTDYKTRLTNLIAGTSSEDNIINKDYFGLNGINARDFGYKYAYAQHTRGVSFDLPFNNITTSVQEIRDFIDSDSSCGLVGGCNNSTPKQIYLHFILTGKLPAEVDIKLWKSRPNRKESDPDLYYKIIFE